MGGDGGRTGGGWDRESSPVRRAILLGASNVARSFSHILPLIQHHAGGPVEVLGAFGHGRSYGEWSRLAWTRHLPGIVTSGLWRELSRRPPLPTPRVVALLTDLGNDLAYGQPVARIVPWVEVCLAQLAAAGVAGEATVVTLLPLQSLERVPPWRFHLARTVLFPGRPLDRLDLLARARELNAQVCRLALAAGAQVVEPDLAWYGFDPIHIRRKAAARAWGEILGRWPGGNAGGEVERMRGLWRLRAQELRLWRWTVRTAQPCKRFPDGTTVALY